MPSAARIGDWCSGHSCWPPRPNIEGSTNVYVNERNWHRQTDEWRVHCCPDNGCHGGFLSYGSSTVYVNSLQAGRIGDPVSCGSVVIMGSGNVYCGD